MKMYVWSAKPLWVVIAQARSIEQARRLALEEIGENDWSSLIRAEARFRVEHTTPAIWIGQNAEFVITDSGELTDAEYTIQKLRRMLSGALPVDKREFAYGPMPDSGRTIEVKP